MLGAIPFPTLDPVAFQAGPFAVRWYGLAYVLAFVVAWIWLARLARRGDLRIGPDLLADLMPWLVVGVIVGGRLGWWLVYHRPDGTPEPWWEPIAFWHGGMSFHGGFAGVTAALIAWCRVRGASFWNTADALTLVAPVGLFFGRLANFINAELVGRPSDVPWAVVFPGETVARHPSQLYEAVLEGPLLIALLLAARRAGLAAPDGRTSALFVLFYGVLRALAEATRQPDAQIGYLAGDWLTMGQVLSALLVVVGATGWVLLGRRHVPRSAPRGTPGPPGAAAEPGRRRA